MGNKGVDGMKYTCSRCGRLAVKGLFHDCLESKQELHGGLKLDPVPQITLSEDRIRQIIREEIAKSKEQSNG